MKRSIAIRTSMIFWLNTGSKEDSPSHTPLNKMVQRREKIEP